MKMQSVINFFAITLKKPKFHVMVNPDSLNEGAKEGFPARMTKFHTNELKIE